MSEALNSPEAKLRRFRSYPKYKDSGVEWLGDIPAHWAIMKTSWLFSIGSGTTPRSEDPAYYGGETPWLTTSELRESVVTSTDKNVTVEALRDLSSLKVHPTGSVVVAMYGATIGRLGILGIPATVNQACCVFSNPRGIDTWFWFYWLQMRRSHLISLGYGGGQPNLSQELLRSIRVTTPPYPEQRAIAAFLDRETAKIDALIEKNERLIELLQEKRTTLITQAVTKGLDPTVPMKDSGVEWLDKYPNHWAPGSLKRWVSTKITDGPHETPMLEDGGVDFISAEAISNGKIDFDRRRGFISQALHEQYCRKCEPVRDDILLCKSGATTGKLAMVEVDFDFSVWSPLALIRAEKSIILPKFLALALVSNYVQDQIIRTWSAGTQPNISMGDLEKLFVIAPSIEEQRHILKHLNLQIGGFDVIMEKIQGAIDRLKEYRTALISAAVTGKIDIRDLS